MTADTFVPDERDALAAACAHRRIVYVELHYGDGTQSNRWECELCAMLFVPLPAGWQLVNDAEPVLPKESSKADSTDVAALRPGLAGGGAHGGSVKPADEATALLRALVEACDAVEYGEPDGPGWDAWADGVAQARAYLDRVDEEGT